VKEIIKKWANLRTVYLRQIKKKTTHRSGDGVQDDDDDIESSNTSLIEKMGLFAALRHDKTIIQ